MKMISNKYYCTMVLKLCQVGCIFFKFLFFDSKFDTKFDSKFNPKFKPKFEQKKRTSTSVEVPFLRKNINYSILLNSFDEVKKYFDIQSYIDDRYVDLHEDRRRSCS